MKILTIEFHDAVGEIHTTEAGQNDLGAVIENLIDCGVTILSVERPAAYE